MKKHRHYWCPISIEGVRSYICQKCGKHKQYPKSFTQKQSWIKENKQHIKVLLVSGVIIFILFSINTYLNSPSYICFKNPDKCVCEEYVGNFRRVGDDQTYTTTEKCKADKLRIKTLKEKDIDDCNRNPREDDKCKCEEVEYYQHFKLSNPYEDRPDCLEQDGFLRYCKVNGLNETFGDYQTKCIKSRPKIECEKGNPDWVEEKLNSYDFCFNKCYQENVTEIPKELNCMDKCKNQTICRKKTDVEKLMDKDCKYLSNILQIWRQKGCKI